MTKRVKRRTVLKAVGSTTVAPLGAVGTMSLAGCSTDEGPRPTAVTRTPDGAREVSVFHYNLGMGDKPDVVDVVIDQIKRRQPTVVSLNEVCETHYEDIEESFPEYNGTFADHDNFLELGGCWEDAGQGIGVLVLDGKQGTEKRLDIGQKTVCISRSGSPPIHACSTHLSAPNDGDPVKEIAELYDEMRKLVDEGAVVVAGDLNLDPWEDGVEQFYTDFHELAQNDEDCGGKGNRPKDTDDPPVSCTFEHPITKEWKKIDYIFVDKEHFTSDVTAEVLPGTDCGDNNTVSCSDHRQLWGTANLKQTDTPRPTSSNPTTTTPEDRQLKWSFEEDYLKTSGKCYFMKVGDPTTCIHPMWYGPYEVAPDGTVRGRGTVELSRDYCGMVIAKQSVTVTGNSPDGGNTLNLTLKFGTAEIDTNNGKCNPEKAQRWARHLQNNILEDTIEIEASFDQDVSLTVSGRPYIFRSCIEYGDEIEFGCL